MFLVSLNRCANLYSNVFCRLKERVFFFMVLPSQEIVNTHVCYSNKGICALLTQPIGRYIEKTVCRFPRDYTYSAAKLPSWLESILRIVTVFSGDQVIESRQDQPEWLWRASCRAAYELQELKKKKKNHWSQTFILFPSWVVFWLWLDAHNLMSGLPPVCGCICKPETVSVWYINYTWLHLQKLSHLRQIVASYRILHQ